MPFQVGYKLIFSPEISPLKKIKNKNQTSKVFIFFKRTISTAQDRKLITTGKYFLPIHLGLKKKEI